MADTAARLAGSGRTILFFGGPDGHIPIVYCQTLNETPPTLVAEHEFIQPMDWPVPSEIMTAQAMGGGTIELGLKENWSEQAWNRLGGALDGLTGEARGGSPSNTILDIVRAISRTEGSLYVTKIIATPQYSSELLDGAAPMRRATYYMNAKIVTVGDGDTDVSVESMSLDKTITVAYTHRLYQYMRATDSSELPQGLPGGFPSGSAGALSRGPQQQTQI